MKENLRKLMLSECRCVTFVPAAKQDAKVELSDAGLARALTVNENLMTLGYTLKPADLVRLADSPSLDTFYEDVRALVGEVKAAPMYPGFPAQVMEISEAQYRFHQMLHYLSTYGLEVFFGEKVSRGWLPYEEDEKQESDTVLLKAQVLELLEQDGAAFTLAERILRRRERMTEKERELVRLALEEIPVEALEKIEIPFKENLTDLFVYVMKECDGDQASVLLRTLCKHTGDVLKCSVSVLRAEKYHLKTSQKRFLVKLLESYPEADFTANLILSLKKAEMSLRVLRHLDYNVYSRSEGHREAVRALRDGELHSWEGQARYLLQNHQEGALEFVAARPGMMLRMVAWMLRLGYPAEEIREKLTEHAGNLSAQTLATTLAAFGNSEFVDSKIQTWKEALAREAGKDPAEKKRQKLAARVEERREHLPAESEAVYGILEAVLSEKLGSVQTRLWEKKIFVDMEEYDLERSVLHCNDKAAEGGYVRSGIAYRIPEDVHRLRFFVYWNDKERVDVDLHASACTLKGENISIGWDRSFREAGIVSSGDITHSDAAEYIDIDLEAPLREVVTKINLFSGKESFGEIATCFVGMMAVDQMGQEVKLYNPANCFFAHELKGAERSMQYGFVDVVNRCLVFDGKEDIWVSYDYNALGWNRFHLQRYMELLFAGQRAVRVERREDADLVLKMGKAEDANEVSFIDNNFFL